MPLRSFRLPADLSLMTEMIPQCFQYPENPDWSVQDDEMQSFLDMANTARRLWPLFSVLWKVSPSLRDVLHGFIWEEDGKPVGIVNVSRDGTSEDWFISNVGVLPSYRRRGIARKLVEAAIGLAREHHATHVLLNVIAGNTPAYELYVALGFEHFASSVELLHDAPAAAAADCPLPHGYTATRLSPTQWKPFYELARRTTPPEIQAYRQVTIQRFRNPPTMTLVIGLMNSFSGVRDLGLVVREGKGRQVVATANVTAHLRGSGMNFCRMMMDPAHPKLAPQVVASTLSILRQRSPRSRIQCHLDSWQSDLIDAAMASDFRRQYEFHTLGMKL